MKYKTNKVLKSEIEMFYHKGHTLSASLRLAIGLNAHDKRSQLRLEALAKDISEAEFFVGDTVTFKPYKTGIAAKVNRVIEYYGMAKDIQYHIKGKGVISHTTGRSILQSKYYEQWTDQKAKK